MVACSTDGCQAEASWSPILLLWAKGSEPTEENCAELDVQIPLCHDHMLSFTVDSFLSPETWSNFIDYFKRAKHPAPDRRTARLKFKHLETGTFHEIPHPTVATPAHRH